MVLVLENGVLKYGEIRIEYDDEYEHEDGIILINCLSAPGRALAPLFNFFVSFFLAARCPRMFLFIQIKEKASGGDFRRFIF